MALLTTVRSPVFFNYARVLLNHTKSHNVHRVCPE